MALPQPIPADQELDCSGQACPLPILQTRKAIEAMQIGQVLKMTSTDLASVVDVQAWTRRTGHQLLGYEDDGTTFVFYIRKTK
jgi:tRNA 2-thiouridine synthesizing protein A